MCLDHIEYGVIVPDFDLVYFSLVLPDGALSLASYCPGNG